jgi:hypothetical protein
LKSVKKGKKEWSHQQQNTIIQQPKTLHIKSPNKTDRKTKNHKSNKKSKNTMNIINNKDKYNDIK